MAKAAKPDFQHAPAAVKTAPHATQSGRKRMAPQTGVYKDKRAAKHGQMRIDQAMTDVRWKKVIAAIANGKTRVEAAKVAGITAQSIDAYLISNVAAYKQLRDAALISNRRNWPYELIEQIFDELAGGLSLKRSCIKHGVGSELQYKSLLRLVRRDKQIRESYEDAREIWAESFLDDTIDIADDSDNDRLENGRINHEVVNRSKLRIDARWRAMGAMVKKRFGDSKHIELQGSVTMNHIAMLTGARKRLEKHRPGTAATHGPVVIENETGEVATT